MAPESTTIAVLGLSGSSRTSQFPIRRKHSAPTHRKSKDATSHVLVAPRSFHITRFMLIAGLRIVACARLVVNPPHQRYTEGRLFWRFHACGGHWCSGDRKSV